MAENNIGSVLVVEGGRLVGIITERDVIRLLAAGRPLTEKLGDVMTRDPVTVKPDTPLIVALARMVEYNIRHLPVVDEKGRPVGVLSVRDVIRNL
ncbi:MAG: CBS domain-containing protein [Desulfurococcales archaeon]|nr:CBS domain-containing protein [Desulfurococcales archaeon]